MTSFKNINDWEVLTPNGWSDFKGIKTLTKKSYIKITFEDDSILECSENHKVKLKTGNFIYATSIKKGMVLLGKDNVDKIVKSKAKIKKSINLYDLIDVKKDQEYYSNDIVSHNCAFIDDADSIWTAAYPTLSTGGRAILLSCVTKDTYVFTNKGIKQVKDFIPNNVPGDYQIKKYDVLGVNSVRNGEFFKNSGVTDTIKIHTKFGDLEGSKIHKLWAYKSDIKKYGWYKLEELSINDYVSIQYGMNVWGNNDDLSNFKPSISPNIKTKLTYNTITKELAYLFGLYIAEGCAYKPLNEKNELIGGNITITCGDKDITWVFDALNLYYYTSDNIHYTISSKNLIELFEFIGFDLSRLANKKIIPQRLLEISKENIIYLLKGIFDGDGSSSKGNISLTSCSPELIHQVRIILNNLGILSSQFKYSKSQMNSYTTTKIKHNYDTYRLEIYGKNALKFFNIVGFCIKRKNDNKQILLNQKLNRNCSHDVIPNSLDLVNELYKNSNETLKSIKQKFGLSIGELVKKTKRYKTENISKGIVITLYNAYKNTLSQQDLDYYDKIIKNNVCWVKITGLTFGKNDVYDFSLPNNDDDFWCHSIIYNGFIGHQTPNGVGGFFHKTWVDSEEKKNKFHPIKLPWNLHPERDQKWRDDQDRIAKSPKEASQELDCNFLSSGNTLIDLNILQWYRKHMQKDPLELRGEDRGEWIWKYPDPNKTYIVCGDVARGDGSDYSAYHVLDAETLEQCAEYKGLIDTKLFGRFLVSAAIAYNNALLIVENTGVGWATIQSIIDIGYPNLFYSSNDLKYVDVQRQMVTRYYNEEKRMVPGFSTTIKTRPIIISRLEQYFREKEILVYSNRLFNELETFVWDKGKVIAMNGYHDDLCMSLALGLWVRDTALRLRKESVEYSKLMLNHIEKTEYSGSLPIYTQRNNSKAAESWNWNIKNGKIADNENLKWLL